MNNGTRTIGGQDAIDKVPTPCAQTSSDEGYNIEVQVICAKSQETPTCGVLCKDGAVLNSGIMNHD